jgi:nitrate reductase NapAB chaperone NapD
MPIMSYIAYPNNLGKEKLVSDLNSIKSCEAISSTNEDIVILVTDTLTSDEEEKVQENLKSVNSLNHLSLVYAGNEIDSETNKNNNGVL